MYTRFSLILTLFTCLLPFNLHAQEVEKKINFSIGSYALAIVYADYYLSDETLSGTAFSASYAISKNVAFRGTFYALNHDVYSDLDVEGSDLMILFGRGFTKPGFKGFVGAGVYNESWDAPYGGNVNFNGIQFNGGIGYNWDVLALDLIIAIRQQSDYNNELNADTAVATSSFNLSVRF